MRARRARRARAAKNPSRGIGDESSLVDLVYELQLGGGVRGRKEDTHLDQEVPELAGISGLRHALSAHHQHLPVLGDLIAGDHHLVPIQVRNLPLEPQDRLLQVDGQLHLQVVAPPHETGVSPLAYLDQHVAWHLVQLLVGLPPEDHRFALAHSPLDRQRKGNLPAGDLPAPAVGAVPGAGLALPVAARAMLLRVEHHPAHVHLRHHHPRPPALRAHLRLGRLVTRTLAGLADLFLRKREVFGGPRVGLLKGYEKEGIEVFGLLHELALLHVLQALLPVQVVNCPLARVGEHFVGPVDFNEASLILLLLVGVILDRQPAEGLLYFLLGRALLHLQHLVKAPAPAPSQHQP
jgi:hypothetical protein